MLRFSGCQDGKTDQKVCFEKFQSKGVLYEKFYFYSTFSTLYGFARIVLEEGNNVRTLIYMYLKLTYIKQPKKPLMSNHSVARPRPRLKVSMQQQDQDHTWQTKTIMVLHLLITTAQCKNTKGRHRNLVVCYKDVKITITRYNQLIHGCSYSNERYECKSDQHKRYIK